MSVLEKIKNLFVRKIFFLKMVVILFNVSILAEANPSGEKLVTRVMSIGPATVTTNLIMFSEATLIGNTPISGTLRGVTFMSFSHNKNAEADGVYYMSGDYQISDDLKGEYKISNVRATVTNSSSASVDIDAEENWIDVEIDDYKADDVNRVATVEIIGDLTYTTGRGEVGKGSVNVTNNISAISHSPVTALINSPIEVNQAITLNAQALNFGNVIPLTGKYEKESLIGITGARGTDVTISLNGAVGQEVSEKLVSGRNKIPITYKIENGSGNIISELKLEDSGIGSAALKGIIDSDNIPRGQVGGAYTGSVTIEVDYK